MLQQGLIDDMVWIRHLKEPSTSYTIVNFVIKIVNKQMNNEIGNERNIGMACSEFAIQQ